MAREQGTTTLCITLTLFAFATRVLATLSNVCRLAASRALKTIEPLNTETREPYLPFIARTPVQHET